MTRVKTIMDGDDKEKRVDGGIKSKSAVRSKTLLK